jgi:hypothetical protein
MKLPYSMANEFISVGVESPGHEVNHSPPSPFEVENEFIYLFYGYLRILYTFQILHYLMIKLLVNNELGRICKDWWCSNFTYCPSIGLTGLGKATGILIQDSCS